MRVSYQAAAKALKNKKQESFVSQQFRLEDILFPEQLAFVKDTSPNKVAVCSRRAGKTVSCAADLVFTACNNPDVVCLYITLSRNNAKKIIWKEITKLNKAYELKGKPNSSELSMTFPNGSIIYLSGAKDTNEIEKFRGLAVKLCYIDEAQSFRSYIKDLIDDVLSPALMDHAGTLCLIGTPGPVPTGYFHDCSVNTNNTWAKHHWTFFNNPFITTKSKKTHEEMLQRELKRRGVKLDDPSIQREWFGKWVLDSDSLLIKYEERINHYENLYTAPTDKFHYVLGVDIGYKDADALAVLAWNENSPVTYLVEEIVVSKQGITELVEQVNYLSKKYSVEKIVMDEGGLGKKIAEEMRRRYLIPVEAAEKQRKMENYALLNDALRTGRFKAKKTSTFAQDSKLLEKDLDKSKPDKIVVSDRFHSDIIDAVLYAFKLSPAYAYDPPTPKPKAGTQEHYKLITDSLFEAALEQQQKIDELEKDPFSDDFA